MKQESLKEKARRNFDLSALSRDCVLKELNLHLLSLDYVTEHGTYFGNEIWWDPDYGYFICYEDGTYFTGLAYELYGDGSLAYYCDYVNGLEHGVNIRFYPSGAIKSYDYNIKGRPAGRRYSWYESGRISGYGEYDGWRSVQESHPVGTAYAWYESGAVKKYAEQNLNGHIYSFIEFNAQGKVIKQNVI